MNCDEVFAALASGEPPGMEKEIAAHLDTCEDCRADADGIAAFKHALKNPELYEKDPPQVRDAILKAAYAKADELKLQSKPERNRQALLALALGAALGFALGFVTGRFTAPAPAPAKKSEELGPLPPPGDMLGPK